MKTSICLCVVICLFAPLVVAEVSPDTVVATINGEKLTAADVEGILRGSPPEMQQKLRADRRQFVDQYALVHRLTEVALENGLEEKTPFKEQLAWNRIQVLMQAAITNKSAGLQKAGASEAELKAGMQKWLEETQKTTEVVHVNQDYFGTDLIKASSVPEDEVIVKVNGQELTPGQVAVTLRGSAPRVRENFQKSRRDFFQNYAMMLRLVEIAEEGKLAEQSPYKEQLAWVRSNVLSQAALTDYTDNINIDRKAAQDYYNEHQDRFTQATVKVLYISFGTGDAVGTEVNGRKVLSETEAREKVEDIRQEILGGADFVEMVREHSQDQRSRDKDGDFGTLRQSDRIPDHIKDAIFSLEAGGVSQVVRQPNGFYIFRVEKNEVQTLDQAWQTVMQEAKSAEFNAWMETVRETIKVTIENEEYFSESAQ